MVTDGVGTLGVGVGTVTEGVVSVSGVVVPDGVLVETVTVIKTFIMYLEQAIYATRNYFHILSSYSK